jgi:RNA polymerase sigma-70 factor (ECF subfamily)
MARAVGSRPLVETGAFTRFYEAQAEPLLLWFTRRVLDPEVALDLTAESFAKAFLGRRRCRGDTEAEAARWLYGIAKHELSRYLRKGKAEATAVKRLGWERPQLQPDEIERLEERAEIEPVRSALAAALVRLPDGQRAAVRYRIVEELPYPEVATRLGVSEQTARARVSRALRALGSLIDEPRATKEA